MRPAAADREVVEGVRAGDATALGAALDGHWPSVVRYLTGYCGDPDQAEDLAQECFVRFWERRRDLKPEGSLRALLFRMARNLAIDERRRHGARQRAAIRADPAPTPRPPDEEVEQRELRTRIASAIDALPARRREVFLLVRHQGLSYKEVAEVLELAPQTVANHLSMALADLRSALHTLRSPGG